MKAAIFIEKFAQFANAPDAVPKMRELMLHLAVHGKLVGQSTNDEPATELLRRSRAEMARRMATGKAKQEKPADPVSDEEATFSLPAGWAWCRLVDAGQFINGLAFKPSDWGSVGRPIIRIQNLSGRNPDYNRTTSTFDSAVLVQDGDILVSWSATLDAFVWRGEEGVLNQHIFRVLPAPSADKGFLFWLLKWTIRQLAESDHAHGLVMSHINRGPFLARPIPLPPLAEQKRIVAKVDELMALCDLLEVQEQERETRHAELARASLARFADAPTPANLNLLFHPSFAIPPADLRKSIFTLAVQGLLVPHDRESVDWETRKLKELTTKIGSGSTPSGGKESYQEFGVPLIRSMNVHFGGFVRDGLAFLNEEQAEKLKNVTVKSDDVLLNITGASIGRVAIAPKDMEGARVNQHVCIVRPTAEVLPAFLELFLASPVVQDLIDDVQVGATREALTKAMIEQFEIPVPSLAEQRRIVAKVNELMALVDQLETQLSASRATAANLLEAVVSELAAQA
jgi:type I restriction enzyme S subunit